MRILHLISQTALGGAERFSLALAGEQARRGHEVTLAACRDNGSLFDGERPPGLQVLALRRRMRMSPRVLLFLVRALARYRPEVLHSHNFAANSWARLLGILYPHLPVVCHEHSGRKLAPRGSRAWVDRLLYRRACAVIAVSGELRDLLRTEYRVPEKRLHLIENGIDVERFAPAPDASRDPLGVVCVASLTEVKNHAGLLAAWKEVARRHPDARLTLVGEGPLRSALETQARADGLEGCVRFVGSRNDVRPFLAKASIFVLPSHREGMPISLLEAMASGLACVASSVGQIPAILRDGVIGTLVPPGDTRALAGALGRLLGDPLECARMGEQARSEAAGRHSIRVCAERIEAVYRLCVPGSEGVAAEDQ